MRLCPHNGIIIIIDKCFERTIQSPFKILKCTFCSKFIFRHCAYFVDIPIRKNHFKLLYILFYFSILDGFFSSRIIRHHPSDSANFARGSVCRHDSIMFEGFFFKISIVASWLNNCVFIRHFDDLIHVPSEIHDNRFSNGRT